jgi:hypothetical protein
MKKMLAFAAILVLSGIAMAEPIDPDADGMSVYFDTEGIEYCLTIDDWAPGPGVGPGDVPAYLLVTRENSPYPGIQAWEAALTVTTNAILGADITLTPGASDYNADPDLFVVGCGGPAAIPFTGDATVIANITIGFFGYEGTASATITLGGVPGSLSFPDGPGYAAEAGFPSPCQPLFGAWGDVAWINGDCNPIANEEMTWGSVKSLY